MSLSGGSPDSASHRQPNAAILTPYFERSTFIAISVEGFLAIALGLSIPSEQGSSFLFGYSIMRIALLSGALAAALLSAVLAVRTITSPAWWNRLADYFKLWLLKSDRAFSVLFGTLVAAGVSIVTLVFYFMFSNYAGTVGSAILQRVWSFIAWFGLVSLHAFSLVARWSREPLIQNRDLRHPRLTTSLVLLFVVVLSCSHWLTLYYALPVLTSIPHWFWTPLTWYGFNTHLNIPVIVAASAVVYLLIKHEWPLRYTIPLFVGLAFMLQLSVGLVQGSGTESLRWHYMISGQSVYARYVSDDGASLSDILNYDEKFRDDFYLGTKPPGYLLLYFMVRGASDALTSAGTYSVRLKSVTTIMSFVFPILASLAIVPIYVLARIFGTPLVGRIACALYVTAPSFMLMALQIDQVLFPVLFATGILLVVITFRSRNVGLAFAAGAFAYCSIYVSFSLIPLLAASGAYLFIAQVQATGLVHPLRQFRLLYSFALGVAVAGALLALLLNFDISSRFAAAIASHSDVMRGHSPGLGTLSDLLLNNVEYASWVGSGLALLSLAGILTITRANGSREVQSLRPLALSGGISWLLMNALGQTRGETGRLWLFFLPFVVLFAAQAIHGPKFRVPRLLALIAAVQTTTAFLILLYQFAA